MRELQNSKIIIMMAMKYDKALYDIDVEEEMGGMTIIEAFKQYGNNIHRKKWDFAFTLNFLQGFAGNKNLFLLTNEDILAEDWQEFKHGSL